jgi:hypothetical protein
MLTPTLLNHAGPCVPIGNRENDIYGLFCTAQELGRRFPVPGCLERLAGDGTSYHRPGKNVLNFPRLAVARSLCGGKGIDTKVHYGMTEVLIAGRSDGLLL